MRYLMLGCSLLVLPLAFLLFAQWPLREWLQSYSRESNDLGQIFFALYVAIALTAASQSGSHLSAAAHSASRAAQTPWRFWAVLLCVGPWAAFMLWSLWPSAIQSLRQVEHFPETLNPGYFLIKLAALILLALVLAQALFDAVRTVHK